MESLIFGITGMCVGIAGVVLSFITVSRNRKNDDKNEGEKEGIILSELDHIKNTTEDIKRKLEKKDEQDIEILERLTDVEASAKQAHKRIDQLFKYHQPN